MGSLDTFDIDKQLKSNEDEANFQGLTLISNYIDDYPPFCYLEMDGHVSGVFPDALRIAANYLNLTLIFRETKQENRGMWANRYKYNMNGIHLILIALKRFFISTE